MYAYTGNNPLQYIDPSGSDRIAAKLVTGTVIDHEFTYKPKNRWPIEQMTGFNVSQLLPNSWFPAESIVSSKFAAKIEKLVPVMFGNRKTPPDQNMLGNRVIGRRTNDDKGHILPFLLGGIDANPDNFFWQNLGINRGEYATFGTSIANLLQPTPPTCPHHFYRYAVNFRYNAYSSNPLRPTSFHVKVTDHNNIVYADRDFDNPPSQ